MGRSAANLFPFLREADGRDSSSAGFGSHRRSPVLRAEQKALSVISSSRAVHDMSYIAPTGTVPVSDAGVPRADGDEQGTVLYCGVGGEKK